MNRKFTTLIASLAAAATFAAQAQQSTVAELSRVLGNVVVSDVAGMSAGANGLRLAKSVRVATTANSETTILFDNGCRVELKENQRFTIDDGQPCAVLLASVQAVPVGTALGAPVAAGVSGTTLALVAGGVGLGIYLINRNNRNSSPN